MIRWGFVLSLCCLFSLPAWSAKPPLRFKPNKLDKFYESGVFVGGEAGRSFSLLDIIRSKTSAQAKSETVLINIGDENGRKVNAKKVGYFHVSVENDPSRIVIDLSQLIQTKVDEKRLAAIFKESSFVKSTDMTMDPEDFSTNMTLYLKKPAKVKVSTPESKGQIVIDIADEPTTQPTPKKSKGKK